MGSRRVAAMRVARYKPAQDAVVALQWINNNRAKFKGVVYDPLVTLVRKARKGGRGPGEGGTHGSELAFSCSANDRRSTSRTSGLRRRSKISWAPASLYASPPANPNSSP